VSWSIPDTTRPVPSIPPNSLDLLILPFPLSDQLLHGPILDLLGRIDGDCVLLFLDLELRDDLSEGMRERLEPRGMAVLRRFLGSLGRRNLSKGLKHGLWVYPKLRPLIVSIIILSLYPHRRLKTREIVEENTDPHNLETP
jgi:hypothetical protein